MGAAGGTAGAEGVAAGATSSPRCGSRWAAVPARTRSRPLTIRGITGSADMTPVDRQAREEGDVYWGKGGGV